jgi:uncharacterized protein YqfA (UPF0365 family)
MADALRSGNMGVMDYMNMKNIEADTDMRDTISSIGPDEDINEDMGKKNKDKNNQIDQNNE